MDFLETLAKARTPKWVRFPNTNFELSVKTLSINEIDRCRKQATVDKKNPAPVRMAKSVYPKAIVGIRGFSMDVIKHLKFFDYESFLKACQEKFGPEFNEETVLASDPIDERHMQLVIGLAYDSGFYVWMLGHTGQNLVIEDEEKEED